MLESIVRGLSSQPFISLFLVVAAGYALGRIRVRGISLGATASTLIVGLALSLCAAELYGVQFRLPEFASTIFFNLFMFAIGMKVGPQFLSGLRRDAGRLIFIALFIPLVSFALTFAVSALFRPAPGIMSGILSGSNTATPGLGAAQAAYEASAAALPSGVTVAEAVSNMSTAFAFSYCVSMVLFIVLAKAPALLGADPALAARRFERSLHTDDMAPLPGTAGEFFDRSLPVSVRAYALEQPAAQGARIGELRARHPLISIEHVERDGRVLEPRDEVVLQQHDVVSLYGMLPRIAAAGARIGPEVYDRVVRDVDLQTVDVVVHHRSLEGKKLGDLAGDIGHGLYLNAMFRAGEPIPHGPEARLRRGDVLRVTGSRYRINILERAVGRVVRASISTDVVTLALGLSLGALIGAITVPLGNMRLTLGAAVGLLLTGIVLSALRTRNPALGGPFPEPARQLLEDLGLNVFIAILGINAGAGVVHAIESGSLAPILVGSLLIGFVPAIAAWWIGARWLKLNTALLMGAVAGGRCNSAGMRASQEATESNVPAISYPVTFAVANVTLTLLAYLYVLLA